MFGTSSELSDTEKVQRVERRTKESMRLAGLILKELSFLGRVYVADEEGEELPVLSLKLCEGELYLYCFRGKAEFYVTVRRESVIKSYRPRIPGLRKRPSVKVLKKGL